VRTSLQRAEQVHTEVIDRIILGLPSSIHDLSDLILDDLMPTCSALLERIEEVAERMVRL
jgi:hypothetical protein